MTRAGRTGFANSAGTKRDLFRAALLDGTVSGRGPRFVFACPWGDDGANLGGERNDIMRPVAVWRMRDVVQRMFRGKERQCLRRKRISLRR